MRPRVNTNVRGASASLPLLPPPRVRVHVRPPLSPSRLRHVSRLASRPRRVERSARRVAPAARPRARRRLRAPPPPPRARIRVCVRVCVSRDARRIRARPTARRATVCRRGRSVRDRAFERASRLSRAASSAPRDARVRARAPWASRACPPSSSRAARACTSASTRRGRDARSTPTRWLHKGAFGCVDALAPGGDRAWARRPGATAPYVKYAAAPREHAEASRDRARDRVRRRPSAGEARRGTRETRATTRRCWSEESGRARRAMGKGRFGRFRGRSM